MYGQVAQSRHLDAQVSALAAQNSALAQQISDREREIADAQTVAWLEQQARQLGYIFPGEQLYVIVPPGTAHASTGGVSVPHSDLQTTTGADAHIIGDAEAERDAQPHSDPRTHASRQARRPTAH